MYISYDRLWKRLTETHLTKTELCEITGISTRTLAKLVKNQSVTTDTLLRICEVLNCQFSDIMEISNEEPLMTLYEAYRQHGTLVDEDEYCRLVEFAHDGKIFRIKEVKKSAGKRVVIHCEENGSVVWEQFYPNGHTPIRTKNVISDLSFVEKGKICILLVGGSSVGITGLDEGRFLSPARPYDARPYEDGKLYVMSKAKFKLFVL